MPKTIRERDVWIARPSSGSFHICALEATALRLSEDGEVKQGKVYELSPPEDGVWYGPVCVILPTTGDVCNQNALDKLRAQQSKLAELLQRLRDVGVSEEDIMLLWEAGR